MTRSRPHRPTTRKEWEDEDESTDKTGEGGFAKRPGDDAPVDGEAYRRVKRPFIAAEG